ncbi:hypothetical protein PGT21_019867 [Puccinia graminis f. sp. tritici]|uniref:Uncharacterized protein n=1 Tax=Puccinia graminis f. sp. tritici TaxID=56615 RepID=A0A5B0MXH0_PUCGR|nr:hypothetical protein PGT21_017812 [Puccinia graminis f. sp. tritici]KAA1080768.1 hypothetical protein PGT21_019867 [Puccinia graminis f. sp. tritici]KAA1134648.1 hypothetical protein PGTUg99_001937 [Puccinia graminis f. sp. tritici]
MENAQKITRSKTGTRKEADTTSQTPAQSTTLDATTLGQDKSTTKFPPSKEVSNLLGRNTTLKEVVDTTSVLPEPSVGDQRSHVWEKIKEAQAAGDAILTKILVAAYKDLEDLATTGSPKLTRSLSALPVLSTVESKKDVPTSATVTELEDNLVYAVGAVTSHQDIGFTPYFDENIRKLKAPLPLTIFDREWQKKAIAAHLTRNHQNRRKTKPTAV